MKNIQRHVDFWDTDANFSTARVDQEWHIMPSKQRAGGVMFDLPKDMELDWVGDKGLHVGRDQTCFFSL